MSSMKLSAISTFKPRLELCAVSIFIQIMRLIELNAVYVYCLIEIGKIHP